jgi:peptide/nickel transport system substrate-binding protein
VVPAAAGTIASALLGLDLTTRVGDNPEYPLRCALDSERPVCCEQGRFFALELKQITGGHMAFEQERGRGNRSVSPFKGSISLPGFAPKGKERVQDVTVSSTRRLAILVGLIAIASLVLTACSLRSEPQTIVQTVQVEVTRVVEKPGPVVTVIETQVVEKEVTVTPPKPTPAPPSEKSYRQGIFGDMTTTNYWASLDPDSSAWNAYVLSNMHPALYTLAYPKILYVPQLATELPEPAVQEGDLWVITATISTGIQWSDGIEVTVNDLIFAADTCLEFRLGGNWLQRCYPDYLEAMEAVDDYTVKIYFKQEPGLAVWQHGVGLLPFMPKHFWKDAVETCRASEDPATCLYAVDGSGEPSAGPFVFAKWEPGVLAEITANPRYYLKNALWTFYTDGAFKEVNPVLGREFCLYGECSGEADVEFTNGPFVTSTIYQIYDAQGSAVMALVNGDVDFLLNPLGLPRDLQAKVLDNPDLAAFQNPSNGFRYLAFNMRKAPNDVQAFRQAVAYLIDKEYLTGNVLQDAAIPVYSMVPEDNAYWHNPDTPELGKGMTREERITKAVQLLKAAGFSWDKEPTFDEDNDTVVPGSTLKGPDGKELAEIELLSPTADYDPMRATAAIWIAQWCNEIGIPVKANPTGFNTILPRVFEPDPETGEIAFDWYILGWSLGDPALPTFDEAFFSCASDAKLGGNNTSGYCNEQFDAWVAGLNSAKTDEEARGYVWKMEEKLAEDVPYVTLFSAPILEFYAKARVSYPFTATLDGLQNLNGVPDLVIPK